MPTLPSPSPKFRMAGFPQYGFKAGMSDRAFPFGACPSRRSVGLRPSCSPLAASESPYCAGGRRALEHLRGERPRPLYPRGPRSGLGSVVPVHPHLFGPICPTRRRISISPLAAYTRCLRCASPPRRPASGSVLSLCVPSRHAVLCDRGEFIGCSCSVPSPTTLAFALSPPARHSRVYRHPLRTGESISRLPRFAVATACRVACPWRF